MDAQGFDNILGDYLHKGKVGSMAAVATWAVRFLTVGTLVGVYSFNTNDIGAPLSLLCLTSHSEADSNRRLSRVDGVDQEVVEGMNEAI